MQGFWGLDNLLSPTEGNLVLVIDFLCFPEKHFGSLWLVFCPSEVLALFCQSLLFHWPQTNFTLGLIFCDSVGIKA